MLTHKQVIARFRHVMYLEPVSHSQSTGKKFITAWLADMDKLTCEQMVVDPSLPFGPVTDMESGYKVFNTFPGFRAATSLEPMDERAARVLVEPILKHVHDWIAGSHAGRAKWFLDWMANILQRPLAKHRTGVVVNGEPEYAKGVLPGFFRECVLGSECTFQTSAVKSTVFARFATGVKSVVFLQLDEELLGMSERGRLNQLITEPSFNYEEKRKNPTRIRNLVNVYMTTDHTTEADISWKYALFEASGGTMGEEYVDGLRAHLARPEVARAFYQFLMARDLSGFTAYVLPPPLVDEEPE